jgi:hypothetical protein
VDNYGNLKDDENINSKIFYKKADDTSYLLFRKITQIIDLICLDYDKLKYNNRDLVAGCILLTILESLNILNLNDNQKIFFEISDIQEIYDTSSNPYAKIIIDCYLNFLHQSFNFDINQIAESLVFISKFFSFIKECVVDIPITVQMAPEDDLEINNVNFLIFILISFII